MGSQPWASGSNTSKPPGAPFFHSQGLPQAPRGVCWGGGDGLEAQRSSSFCPRVSKLGGAGEGARCPTPSPEPLAQTSGPPKARLSRTISVLRRSRSTMGRCIRHLCASCRPGSK